MEQKNMKPFQDLKVAFVGAGNVATHLSQAMFEAGVSIVGVHSATRASSEVFYHKYGAAIAEHLSELPEADLCVFAVKDSVLEDKIKEFGQLHRHEICLHTAGSMPMDLFKGNAESYGVIYPLQTFSRDRKISFRQVPLFVEADSETTLKKLLHIAESISDAVNLLSSIEREQLHLAAVFACNFSNHCYAMASKLLENAGLSDRLLIPLITETFNKFSEMQAVKAQTGPAVRYDVNVMNKHLSLLDNDKLRSDVYRAMSESIHNYAENQKNALKENIND